MRRVMMGLVMAIGMVVLPATRASAMTLHHPKISMELVILMPKRQALGIYQEVVISPAIPTGDMAFDIIPNARHVRGLGTRVKQVSSDQVVIASNAHRMAVRYSLPWDGSSASVALPSDSATASLLVLVPKTLSLPPVLNPALEYMGSGKIPGVALSPTFREYATSHVSSGQSVPLVLEKSAAFPTSHSNPTGNHPIAAALFEGAVVMLGLAALLVALNWRPRVNSRRARLDNGMLDELGRLRAKHRSGRLSHKRYQEAWNNLVIKGGDNE